MAKAPTMAIAGGRLRAWLPGDAATLVEAWHDPDVAAWNPVPADASLAAATNWLAGVADRASRLVSLDWAVERALPGGAAAEVVGEVGLSGFSDKHNGVLIGYWLLPSGRRRGLASRAVAAVSTWAHEALELDMIIARCHESNAASQAVAARAGYRHERNDSTGHQLWISRSSEV